MSAIDTAADFIVANDQSPVIAGHVIELEHGGGQYTLDDGRIFRMTAEECRKLPAGYPKWKIG